MRTISKPGPILWTALCLSLVIPTLPCTHIANMARAQDDAEAYHDAQVDDRVATVAWNKLVRLLYLSRNQVFHNGACF